MIFATDKRGTGAKPGPSGLLLYSAYHNRYASMSQIPSDLPIQPSPQALDLARQVLRIEGESVLALCERIGDNFMQALALILVLKVFATVAAIGSGPVGGVFTPTLFVGAVLGGLFGLGMEQLWPAAVPMSPGHTATA